MPISVASPRDAARLAGPLRALVRAALAAEGRRAGEIGVVLTDDSALRALNRRWRGIDRATDVLSFPYDPGGDGPVSGDVVVSLDRMRDQARRYRVSRGRECARLVVHGALHLAGLDHHRTPERRHMRTREQRILRAARAQVAHLDRILARDPSGGEGRARPD